MFPLEAQNFFRSMSFFAGGLGARYKIEAEGELQLDLRGHSPAEAGKHETRNRTEEA